MALATLFVLTSLAALQAGGDPVARWAFDGDVKDSGPSKLPTRALGRLDFIDSPVGGSGKAAVFNGVDAFVQVDPDGALGVGAEDFTATLWVFALEKRTATLLARKGWSLVLTDAGALQFTSEAGSFATPPGVCPPAQWNHVALSVKRRIGAKLSRILVNGW